MYALKITAVRAVSTALVQIVQLFFAGADASRAGRIVTRTTLGFNLIFRKNEEFTRWQWNGTALVILPRFGVVLVANVFRIILRGIHPTSVAMTCGSSTVVSRTQFLGKSFLN